MSAALCGCASPDLGIARESGDSSVGEVVVLDVRPIVVTGEPIVLQLEPIPGPDPAGRAVSAELDDGTRLRAEIHRVYIGAPVGPANWLAHARRWGSGSGMADADQRIFARAIDIAIVEPIPAGDARVLRIAGATAPLERRSPPDPGLIVRLAAGSPLPLGIDSPEAMVGLFAALRPGLEDPTIRWRGALLADRLESAGRRAIADRIRAVNSAGLAVNALARSIEIRWRLALDRLARIDAGLAADVLDRLTMIVSTPVGAVLPGWTPAWADSGLDAVLDDLLNQSLSDTDAAARVRAWLAGRDEFIAWVIDDAGLSAPGAGVALARAGVVDFSGRGGVAMARLENESDPGPRLTVAPYSWGVVAASGALEPGAGSMNVEYLGRSRTLSAAALALVADPPGYPIGPAFEPWSLGDWRAGSPVIAGGDRATLGLLRRRVGGEWEIYLECRTPNEKPTGDRVRLWLGPTGRPNITLVIDARGFVYDERMESPEESAPRTPITITRNADRWSCVVDLPESAIEPPGVVRIALDRLDDAGDRRTWPRPLMPGQAEPGRAMISLTRWMGFEAARD